MLSTTSGFTQDQVQRFKGLFFLLLVGIVILIFGIGILCFGRMYSFDATNYDLFLVFGIIIVIFSVPVILLPVYCQLCIFLEVRKEARSDAEASKGYQSGFVTGLPAGTSTQLKPIAVPYQAGTYQNFMPFSSAAYMMSKQQMMPPEPQPMNASIASDNSARQQIRTPTWSPTGRQEPI